MGEYEPEHSDSDTLQRLRLRQIDAIEQLVEHYGQTLTRIAYLHLGDAQAAEDAVQDTFIAAWDGAHRTRPDASLRPWLFGILFNTCRKYQRSWLRRLRRENMAAARREQNENNTDDGRLEAVRAGLAGLKEDLRIVMILRYQQGLTVAQTAGILGLPEGTVKSRTFAAVQMMRTFMRQADGPD